MGAPTPLPSAKSDSPPSTPKRGRGRPPGSPNKPKGGPALEPRLRELLGSAAEMASVFDPVCGGVARTQAPQIARALDHVAREHPSFRARLEAFLATSSLGELIVAVSPVAIAVMAHHNLMPAQLAGAIGGIASVAAAEQADAEPAQTVPGAAETVWHGAA